MTGDLTERELTAARFHTGDLSHDIVGLGLAPVALKPDAREMVHERLAIFYAYQERRIDLTRKINQMTDQRNGEYKRIADRAERQLAPFADVYEAVVQYLWEKDPDETDLRLLRERIEAIEETMSSDND